YIGLGVKNDDKREIEGLKDAQAESEENWLDLFDYIKERGFMSSKLIISDANEELNKMIKNKFIGTDWQRRTVNLIRNIFDKMPKKDFHEAKELIKAIYEAPTLTMSRELKEKFVSDYSNNQKYEKVIKILEDGYDDTVQFYSEPRETHTHIKTTNVLER